MHESWLRGEANIKMISPKFLLSLGSHSKNILLIRKNRIINTADNVRKQKTKEKQSQRSFVQFILVITDGTSFVSQCSSIPFQSRWSFHTLITKSLQTHSWPALMRRIEIPRCWETTLSTKGKGGPRKVRE